MVQISIISLVLVKLCWFIQFEKSPVSETNEIYLHQKPVSHRRDLPPVAPTLWDRWLWGRVGNQWNNWR